MSTEPPKYLQDIWEKGLGYSRRPEVDSFLEGLRGISPQVVEQLRKDKGVGYDPYWKAIEFRAASLNGASAGESTTVAVQKISQDGTDLVNPKDKTKKTNTTKWIVKGSLSELGSYRFGPSADKAKVIVVTESVIDALSARSCMPADTLCVATGSTNNLKPLDQLESNQDKVCIFFDNDEKGQGQEATRKAASILPEAKYVDYGDCSYKDVNEILLGRDSFLITDMVQNALPLKRLIPDEQGGEDFTKVDIEKLRSSRFLIEEPQPYVWTLEDTLLQGAVGGIVSNGGVGKGFLALQLALSVSLGLPFLDGQYAAENSGRVFCMFGEDTEQILHHRMVKISRALIEPKDMDEAVMMLDKNLYVQSVCGYDTRLMKNTGGNPEATPVYEKLLDRLSKIDGLRLVLLDPLSRYFTGLEIDPTVMTYFCSLLERIALQTGATVLVTHHTHKGSGRGRAALIQEAVRGTTAFSNAVRWQLNLATLDTREIKELRLSEEQTGGYMVCKVSKKNVGFPETHFYLKRGDGGVLRLTTVDESQGNADRRVRRAAMEKIMELAAKKKQLTLNQFGKEYASVWENYGRDRLKSVIETAILKNKILSVPTKNTKGKTVYVLAAPTEK